MQFCALLPKVRWYQQRELDRELAELHLEHGTDGLRWQGYAVSDDQLSKTSDFLLELFDCAGGGGVGGECESADTVGAATEFC